MKDHFFQVEEWSSLRHRKSNKDGKRPTWVSKELLIKLKHKRQMQAGTDDPRGICIPAEGCKGQQEGLLWIQQQKMRARC